jgi:hypothetical protein
MRSEPDGEGNHQMGKETKWRNKCNNFNEGIK